MTLVVRNMTYEVGAKQLFPPLSVTAYPGDRVVLLGGSGSGKSTVCRLLGGRLPASLVQDTLLQVNPYYVGRLTYDTMDLPTTSYIGPVPDTQVLSLTVRDAFGGASEADVMRAIGSVSMEPEILARDPATLSTGEATRILLAAAVTASTDMIVADSPWGWIDSEARKTITESYYSEVRGRIVVEPESTFGHATNSLKEKQVRLVTTNPTAGTLGMMQESARDLASACPAKTREGFRVVGNSTLFSGKARFTLRVPGLELQTGAITWAQGENGTGKTTFARALAALPAKAGFGRSRYVIKNGDGQEVNCVTLAGYVNGRWPLGEPGLSRSVSLLVDDSTVTQRFSAACGSALSPSDPARWATSPVLSVAGSTAYQLAIGRRIIVVDEPFSDATSSETNLLAELLRLWAIHFDAALVIISHLANPPRLPLEPIVKFARVAHDPGAFTEAVAAEA
jgi:energy-coupling factor transporter ATP-binding protein EcfA2